MGTISINIGAKNVRVDTRLAKLSKKKLTSLEMLAPLRDAEELDISYNALTSIADLPAMPKLHTLYAYGMKLRDVQGIERAPALKKVYIDAKDATGLAKLKQLDLVITNTEAKDLRFLAGLKSLRYLSIFAPLTSFAGIEKLPGLEELVVHGAKLSALTAVKHPALWKLIVSDSGLERVPDLSTPKLLICLLHDNAISSIGRIDAPVLRDLSISGNPLTHLDGIERLPGLEQLSFDGRRIKTMAKATDAHLRARAEKLKLFTTSRGTTDYATFAATKQIV